MSGRTIERNGTSRGSSWCFSTVMVWVTVNGYESNRNRLWLLWYMLMFHQLQK